MFIPSGAIMAGVAAARAAEEKTRQLATIKKLRAETQNPNTDPNRLATIATQVPPRARWETQTWQAVYEDIAANPNTPPHALIERLVDCAPVVVRNPAFPLMFLERPDWLNHLSHDTVGALLRLNDVPPLAVAALLSHPNTAVVDEAQHHIACAGAEAEPGWRDDLQAHLSDIVTGMRDIERQLHVEMVELGLAPRWVAGSEPWPEPPDVGRPELMRMIQGGTPEEKAQLSEARTTETARALERLARKNSTAVRTAVLGNPAATPRALYRACAGRRRVYIGIGKLAVTIPWGISTPFATAAASHANADALLLWHIAGCASAPARRQACRHPKARQPMTERRCRHALVREVFQALQHPVNSRGIRVAGFVLLSNPKLASGTRLRHAADSCRWTDRIAVALNPRTSRSLLKRLTTDGHIWVRAAARTRLNGEAQPA